MGKTNGRWRPRREPVQGRSRETVGYILEAAAQLFGESGYAKTTTNRVAERAGVSIGSVYQYFPNKEALLLALAERHLDEARADGTAALRRLRGEDPTPEEFLRAFVDNIVDFHRDAGPLHDLFFEEAPQTGRIWELVGTLDAACAAEVEVYLRERGLGGPDPALKALVLAKMVGSLTHGMVLDPPPEYAPADCAEEVVAACVGYLGLASNASAE
jgi:AcrR family transcriptional regulator